MTDEQIDRMAEAFYERGRHLDGRTFRWQDVSESLTSFHADSTASDPPVVKKTRLRSPGASSGEHYRDRMRAATNAVLGA